MEFENVWLLTKEHLKNFGNVLKSNNIIRKLLCMYKLPENFPCIQLDNTYFPIVFISEGNVIINNNEFRFEAQYYEDNYNQYHNIDNKLSFSIRKDQIISISDYVSNVALFSYYNISFIQIKSSATGLQSNFLICCGGNRPKLKKIRKKTSELRRLLKIWELTN